METKKRERLLLILTGTVLFLWLADYVIVSPLLNLWKQKGDRIEALNSQLRAGHDTIKLGDAIRSQWDKMQTNALPSNATQAEEKMLKSFDRWERAAGISRQSIRPQMRMTDEDYATLECHAEYTADMDKLFRFLYEMERDPSGLKIEEIELASRDDTGSQITLTLQVSGLVLNPEKTGDQ